MIKVCTALPRRSDHTRAQFQQHWGTVHRDFALRIDRISRYVQSHPLDVDLPGLPPAPYDGFPEVWFPDLDAAVALGSDPQYVGGAHVDEPRFIDVDRMLRTWVTPHLVRPWDDYADTPDAGKIIVLVSGPSTSAVRDALADAVEPLRPERVLIGTALDDPRVRDRQGFDQVVELWWRDQGSAVAAWQAGVAGFVAAAGPALDPATSAVALVREQRVRWPGDVADED